MFSEVIQVIDCGFFPVRLWISCIVILPGQRRLRASMLEQHGGQLRFTPVIIIIVYFTSWVPSEATEALVCGSFSVKGIVNSSIVNYISRSAAQIPAHRRLRFYILE